MADYDGLGDMQRVQHADDILCDAGDRDCVIGVRGAGGAVCVDCDTAVDFCKMRDYWVIIVL